MNELNRYLLNAGLHTINRPAGLLKEPFISPGSIYSAEMWDWDTLWSIRALLGLARESGQPEWARAVLNAGVGSLRNFLSFQGPDGKVPTMITAKDGDRFDCLKPSPETNQAKPVLGQLALDLLEYDPEAKWLEECFDGIVRHLESWWEQYLSPVGLLVWGSDVAVGIDNDPTVYGRPPFSCANLLLNCLYYKDLRACVTLAEHLGRDSSAWSDRADKLAEKVDELCWDSRDGFFYSVDVQCVDHRAKLMPWAAPGMDMKWNSLPLRIQMFTGFLPLWAGIATREQAAEIVERHLLDPKKFWSPHGVCSLSREEPYFDLSVSSNPSNWTGPIWILAQYLVWIGLNNYGYRDHAQTIATETQGMLVRDFLRHGRLHEYYDPDSGEGIHNPGFVSWNALVFLMSPGGAGNFSDLHPVRKEPI